MGKNNCEFIRDIGVKRLGDVLKMKLNIPIYQRDYAWEKEDIESFLEDVNDLYDDTEKSHFLGQIVVHYEEENGKYNIIDGQQRLSTAIMLINNIQKISKEYHEKYLKEYKNVSGKFYDVSADARPFVEMKNEYNLKSRNPFFETVLNKEAKDIEYKHNKVNKKIKKCDEMVEESINKKLNTVSEVEPLSGEKIPICEVLENKCKVLEKILDIVVDKFIVIYLETAELEKAFIIFESLNAMGKTLETAELLKNYILMKSEDKEKTNQIKNANNTWNKISENINQIDMTTFIRHFWNSQHDFVRKEDLYRALVKEISNYDDVCRFLKSLERNSETYTALYFPYESDSFKSSEIKETIENINSLGAKTYYPIVLALKDREYEEKYILDVLRILENYIFRNYTICGKNPNKAEPKFAQIAKKIYDEGSKVEDINAQILGDDAATEEEFKISFLSKTLGKVDAVKYLLRKIHNYISVVELKGEGEKALSLLKKSSEDIHLEHILPQKPQKWIDAGIITDEEAAEYLWKLGNMTLLGKEFNEIIQNDLYGIKKEKGYNKSCIHPNEKLKETGKWDIEEINNRQELLYEYAKNIWTKDGLKF